MSHTVHGDVHEIGLVDGCPECESRAESPTRDLDETMIRLLVQRALDRRAGVHGATGRSIAEDVAVAQITNTLERAGRIAECAPDLLAAYLTEYWRLPTTIQPRSR